MQSQLEGACYASSIPYFPHIVIAALCDAAQIRRIFANAGRASPVASYAQRLCRCRRSTWG